METRAPERSVSETAPQLLAAVEKLIGKHRLVESLAHRQAHAEPNGERVEALAPRQHLRELAKRLEDTHPADVAFVLEGLPPEDRLLVWSLVPGQHGEILLELSDAVRESLLDVMEPSAIVAATRDLDADEIADLAPNLSDEVVQDILESQDLEDRAELQTALSYEEGTVGALMDFDVVSIREDVTCEVALRYLRRYEELPGQTDAIFVVDREDHLRGVVPLKKLIVTDEDVLIGTIMDREVVSFSADGEADEAAESFDRYDLVSAPVVDSSGRVIGRVTVDAVLEYVRERQEAQALGKVGLREDEDLFASVWDSAKNRGPWLALNLGTAFFASRVVGAFEGSIEKLAALAALMPIVAGIGGNSGNQTTTLIVRSLALGQVTPAGARRLLARELGVSALNGVVWGGVLGLVAFLLYRNVALGGVMALAMLLNLLVAALAGFFIPLTMERFGRDPAVGSSVFLTFITDSMGFFIFLGLATVFLL